nr:leucine--tRNA ligase [Bacteroidota bacterium]
MEYNFKEIEQKWQQYWKQNATNKTSDDTSKPKYYVLDMFPYPSGAGLHVGHPLGYIASDIFARHKKLQGYNVLHPMGYDSFGLPAEQYAIQTGQHPAITTEENIARYREQLDRLGFNYDWDCEVRTSDPAYYKWTQWIFIQLFHSWYNCKEDKAENIETLVEEFTKNGNKYVSASTVYENIFSADEWNALDEPQQQKILMDYRLAYLSETFVNWCPQLGTVLANDEIKDGLSERGGYPVERKLMMQWSMRITAYAQHLLDGLDTIDWPDSIKEAQRNWIGRSEGCSLIFKLQNQIDKNIEVFTTRIDTVFGASFITLAPEHELVNLITTEENKSAVNEYVAFAKNRSERERQAEVKNITGVFTGAYAIHPFTSNLIPVWIGDYVLAGYGTGAVMAVPAHDSRDYAFAKHFNLPILEVVSGGDITNEAFEAKEGTCINSDFLNGLQVKDAIKKGLDEVEKRGIGLRKINYRLRDAIFGRQRYWGEPIPVYYKNGTAYTVSVNKLPLVLPEVDKYLPTESGEPPLARAKNWNHTPEGDNNAYPLETTTMPGWAGSSWYFLRYMDAKNDEQFVSKEKADYWKNVDLYMGGAEHATGHLLYVRFWTKFLNDRGYIAFSEPAKKLINQGMIQGTSALVYRVNGTNKFVSFNLRNNYETSALHVDVNIVDNSVLDTEKFKAWREDFANAEFILEDGKYFCGHEVEKMSKRWYNVVNPDDMCNKFGTDCLRMYEMFLGPVEQSKPWNTNGITGVSNFLRKMWRLYTATPLSDENPSLQELKILHRTIKKVTEDIERFSFNTSVSTFMIATNELLELKCNKKQILEPLSIILSPYAPHIAEEFWSILGNKPSITNVTWPVYDEQYLKESDFDYPVSVNGKVKFKINIALSLTAAEIEQHLITTEKFAELTQGNKPKKIIVVHGRIINLVL